MRNTSKKVISLMMVVVIAIILCACSFEPDPNYKPPEQPHLYWKDIDVVVVSVSRNTWFATVHRRKMSIAVKSEEYGLEKTLHYESSGMFNDIPCWDAQEGDVVKAQLYSWVMDSTGQVTRRDINKLY